MAVDTVNKTWSRDDVVFITGVPEGGWVRLAAYLPLPKHPMLVAEGQYDTRSEVSTVQDLKEKLVWVLADKACRLNPRWFLYEMQVSTWTPDPEYDKYDQEDDDDTAISRGQGATSQTDSGASLQGQLF